MRSEPVAVTDPDLASRFLQVLREATPAQRGALTVALTEAVRGRLRLELRRDYPHANDLEIGLKMAEHFYGAELVQRVRDYLASRGEAVERSS